MNGNWGTAISSLLGFLFFAAVGYFAYKLYEEWKKGKQQRGEDAHQKDEEKRSRTGKQAPHHKGQGKGSSSGSQVDIHWTDRGARPATGARR